MLLLAAVSINNGGGRFVISSQWRIQRGAEGTFSSPKKKEKKGERERERERERGGGGGGLPSLY